MKIGERIGKTLAAGDIVAIEGVLGSGKSVLARGMLGALGFGTKTPSPSFVIVATYEGKHTVNHIDLYRLESPEEALSLGLEEMLYSEAINVVEWAEKISQMLPPSRIDLKIELMASPEERLITILPSDEEMKRRFLPLAEGMIRG